MSYFGFYIQNVFLVHTLSHATPKRLRCLRGLENLLSAGRSNLCGGVCVPQHPKIAPYARVCGRASITREHGCRCIIPWLVGRRTRSVVEPLLSLMAGIDSERGIGVNFTEQSLRSELTETFEPVKQLLVIDDDPFRKYRGKSTFDRVKLGLFTIFPIFEWLSTYKLSYLPGDIVGGLTIASLAVPQVRPCVAFF